MARTTRFVVFGLGRNGSTLLASLLDSYPSIRCERELLNPEHGYVRPAPLARALRLAPMPLLALRTLRCPEPVYGFRLLSQARARERAGRCTGSRGAGGGSSTSSART